MIVLFNLFGRINVYVRVYKVDIGGLMEIRVVFVFIFVLFIVIFGEIIVVLIFVEIL